MTILRRSGFLLLLLALGACGAGSPAQGTMAGDDPGAGALGKADGHSELLEAYLSCTNWHDTDVIACPQWGWITVYNAFGQRLGSLNLERYHFVRSQDEGSCEWNDKRIDYDFGYCLFKFAPKVDGTELEFAYVTLEGPFYLLGLVKSEGVDVQSKVSIDDASGTFTTEDAPLYWGDPAAQHAIGRPATGGPSSSTPTRTWSFRM